MSVSGLTLALSWGGTEYPWTSTTILGLFAGSVVALAVFVIIETQPIDPILPMRLFRSSVFSISVILAFIVGFAMPGGDPGGIPRGGPVAGMAFVLALFLKEVPLRGTSRAAA